MVRHRPDEGDGGRRALHDRASDMRPDFRTDLAVVVYADGKKTTSPSPGVVQ